MCLRIFLFSSFASLHHLLPDCSGSVDDCATLYFPYLLTSDYRQCSPVRKYRGLLSTPVHLCPLPTALTLSAAHTLRRHSHVDTPFAGPITTPVTKAYCPFCLLLSHTEAEVHVDTYRHIHPQTEGVFSIKLEHTVFTLGDP